MVGANRQRGNGKVVSNSVEKQDSLAIAMSREEVCPDGNPFSPAETGSPGKSDRVC